MDPGLAREPAAHRRRRALARRRDAVGRRASTSTGSRGLVGKPRLRPIALRLLGDRRRVARRAWACRGCSSWRARRIRSSRSSRSACSSRASSRRTSRGGRPGGRRAAALGARHRQAARERAPVRRHVPEGSPPRARPRLPRGQGARYHAAPRSRRVRLPTVRPLFDDDRVDVRRLAVAIAGEELVRWGDPDLVYSLAGSPRPEPRALGGELLLGTIAQGDVRRVPGGVGRRPPAVPARREPAQGRARGGADPDPPALRAARRRREARVADG